MIEIKMTPLMSNLRVYDVPDGYEKRLPYIAILNIFHMNDKTAYLMGAVGIVNRDTWHKAFAMLHANGITKVMLERRGEIRIVNVADQLKSKERSQ